MSVTETESPRRFVWPAEYYSGPTPAAVLPKWATFGCGGASLLVLVILFAGGAMLSSGGLVDVMDMVFGMTMGELRAIYTPDVTAAQKQALETEIETLRTNLREKKVPVQRLDPVLQEIRRASSDGRVTPNEVDLVTAAARRINASPAPRPAS